MHKTCAEGSKELFFKELAFTLRPESWVICKEGKSMDKGPEVETIDTLEEEEDVSVDGEK